MSDPRDPRPKHPCLYCGVWAWVFATKAQEYFPNIADPPDTLDQTMRLAFWYWCGNCYAEAPKTTDASLAGSFHDLAYERWMNRKALLADDAARAQKMRESHAAFMDKLRDDLGGTK